MFIEYDASKGINNQEIKAEQVVLDFKPAYVKACKELSSSVLATMQDSDLVKHFVQLCTIKIKFLFGCSVSWQGSDESVVDASATRVLAGAISDGEEDQAAANDDDDDDDQYGADDDRGGDRVVNFVDRFDAEHALDCDWSDFKYPVAAHFLTRFREALVIAAMFHLN